MTLSEKIWNQVYSFEHNYLLDATLFGEPNLSNNVLCYKDSVGAEANISVALFPMPLGDPEAEKRAMELVTDYAFQVRTGLLRSLKIFGSQRLLKELHGGFQDIARYYYRSSVSTGDYVINEETRTQEALVAYRRAVKKGYSLQRNLSKRADADHIDMLRGSVSLKKYQPIDQMFISVFSLWMNRADVKAFDIFRGGKRVGFFLIHEWNPQLAFHLITLSHPEEPYIGDYAMGEMYRMYAFNDGQVILGPASTPNLDRFKRKWAKLTGGDPVEGLMVCRNPDDESWRKHLYIWCFEAAYSFLEDGKKLVTHP